MIGKIKCTYKSNGPGFYTGNKAQANREIKQYQEEQRQAANTQPNTEPKTIERGGVVFAENQIVSCLPKKVMGYPGYEAIFTNGMRFEYIDQNLNRRNMRQVGAVFTDGTNIHFDNVINGFYYGTKNSENIFHRNCYNIHFDGNGGDDNYYSQLNEPAGFYQNEPYSYNTYYMHKGDYYEKTVDGDSAAERNAATQYNFIFTDNPEHREYTTELGRINEEFKRVSAHSRSENAQFRPGTVTPQGPDEELTTAVNINTTKSRKQIESEKLLQAALDFQKNIISHQLRENAVKLDASIAEDIEKIEILEAEENM